MPKLNSNKSQIPLSQIRETGNVRRTYEQTGIIDLAKSIEKNGLINPVTVKLMDTTDEFGNPQYELICGHRRKRAYEYLQSQGADRTQIPAIIVTGNKLNLQLIENVQRENLSPEELEQALNEMLKSGMTQTQIAAELAKPLSWVNDSLKGGEVRTVAETAGIDTAGIATKTLSTFRSLPKEKIPEAVTELKENGGTIRTATKIRDQIKTDPKKIEPKFESSTDFERPEIKKLIFLWKKYNAEPHERTAQEFYNFLLKNF